MKNCIVVYFLLFFLLVNCTNSVKTVEADKVNGIKEIDIMSKISNNQDVNLSTVASSIDYCVLESDVYSYVTPAMSVYCSEEHVVAIGGKEGHEACYVFDRKTGKFVRQISRKGQGPGEYLEVISSFWDGDKNQIAVWNGKQYLFYNLDGSLSHTTGRFRAVNFFAYNNLYISHVPNSSGKKTIRIAFHDKTGAFIDSIPEYRTWEKIETRSAISLIDSKFYTFRNSIYYKDIFCDTLYQIKDFSLYPRFIFNSGNRTVPYQMQEGGRFDYSNAMNAFLNDRRADGIEIIDRYKKYVVVNVILEDANNLYFSFDYEKKLYPAIYNKTNDNLQIMLPITLPALIYGRNTEKNQLYGFKNDLDGGLPFWPKQMISEKEMMCVYTVEELLSLDVTKITNNNLKRVLSSLDEDSNPVIAIATLINEKQSLNKLKE